MVGLITVSDEALVRWYIFTISDIKKSLVKNGRKVKVKNGTKKTRTFLWKYKLEYSKISNLKVIKNCVSLE